MATVTGTTSDSSDSDFDEVKHGYTTIVKPDSHGGKLTLDNIEHHTNGFQRPALFKSLVDINRKFLTREFYEQIDSRKKLQWRVKTGNNAATMRSADGAADYNYVSGKIGTGAEFLDDIFVKKLDVYSHLGTISTGYVDPYKWGREAFKLVREEVFRGGWFDVADWQVTGHMFLGNSTQDFGEPANGAVGSDWHMFPTLNIFVMIAGKKKWWTAPCALGDQFRNYDKMFPVSSGREWPGGSFVSDLMIVEPGDVLLNPPFEWHKVLNARGFTLGGAFRVIDKKYLSTLAGRSSLDLAKANPRTQEDLAHFLTSLSYASRDLKRAQMILNDVEYAYLHGKNTQDAVYIE